MNNCGIRNDRDTEPRDISWRPPSDIHAVERDRAGVGLEIAGDEVNEGCFAGAIGAIRLTFWPAARSRLRRRRRPPRESAFRVPARKARDLPPPPFSAATGAQPPTDPFTPRLNPERANAARHKQNHAEQENAENDRQVSGRYRLERNELARAPWRRRTRRDALIAGEHRHEDEFVRSGPEANCGSTCRCAIRAKAPLAPASIAAITKLTVTIRTATTPRYSTRRLVFANRKAGKAELGPEQDGGDARKPCGHNRQRVQHEVGLARIGEDHAEQARPPTLKLSEPPSAVDLTSAPERNHRQREG